MIVLGLTGSIGMGKSTALAVFADLGCPTWDADAAVHRLYGPDGAGAREIARLAPDAVGPDGVDRSLLRAAILAEPALLTRIEAAIHPLVAEDRDAFLAEARIAGARIAVCDIPLLFETGADNWLDRIAVVSAPADTQRARVLSRPGMTEAALDAILAKQVPDAEKRARADYVIDTSQTKDHARGQIEAIVAGLLAEQPAGEAPDA
ncbi:MAG: dephospho-CoA kinase [Paracoccaceae bacterium]|nr:dephospho-CoA kinase [Paracoccaceae bacterium]